MRVNVRYVEHIPDNLDPETLYISEKYGVAVHLCPKPHYKFIEGDGWSGVDGDNFDLGRLMQEKIQNVLPLKPIWTDGWELIKNSDGTVSIKPSILNRGCKHHYSIRNSEVIWA